MNTPATTIAVPSIWVAETGSSNTSAAIAIVATGPTMPVCDAGPEPTRSMAIITRNTGNTVQHTALIAESPYSGQGWVSSATGSVSRACATHSRQATTLAQAVKRIVPMPAISSPAETR